VKVAVCGLTTWSRFIRMTWSRDTGRCGKGASRAASCGASTGCPRRGRGG
jgi:hypothetical protein